MSKIVEISKMLNRYLSGEIKFDAPIKVKVPTGEFWIYAVCKHDQYGIYVMDRAGEWHGPLLASQANGEKVISSVYDRLKLIEEKNYAAVN
jgi:hypothetical protein